MFNQTFTLNDLPIIGVLIFLEGVLSIDNALVLGLLAKRVDKQQQSRALTYGLIGAFVFRFLAIAVAQVLLKQHWVKLVGGGYLVYVAIKYFWEKWASGSHEKDEHGETIVRTAGFWPTVAVIELTDIAFAVDSILAAIALVGSNQSKLWVIVTGGMLGVILMRFAAVAFIRLLEAFPRFETTAYLLVFVIGGKLVLDWMFNTNERHVLDFHSPSHIAFWAFWGVMLACVAYGFIPKKKDGQNVAVEGRES